MIKFVTHKLMIFVPTLLGVSILSFALIRMVPGDPVLLLLGERGASPELYQEMKANLGLDKPIIVQYFTFLGNVLQGDLGTSIISKRTVWHEFTARFPATLELGVIALIIAIIFGIPFGIIAAVKKNSIYDFSIMGISLVGYSMPIFWWGLILILFFSVTLGWTPVAGRISVFYDVPVVTGFMTIDTLLSPDGWEAFLSAWRHIILPALALGTIPLAVIARMTRSSMLEVMQEDYIRTAHSKGLPTSLVILKHGLRNALTPIITVIGLMFGTIITGAILTETIFSWPGIGKWMVASVTARDYPVIQGGVILIAFLIMIINMLVDLSYALVNPKIRKG